MTDDLEGMGVERSALEREHLRTITEADRLFAEFLETRQWCIDEERGEVVPVYELERIEKSGLSQTEAEAAVLRVAHRSDIPHLSDSCARFLSSVYRGIPSPVTYALPFRYFVSMYPGQDVLYPQRKSYLGQNSSPKALINRSDANPVVSADVIVNHGICRPGHYSLMLDFQEREQIPYTTEGVWCSGVTRELFISYPDIRSDGVVFTPVDRCPYGNAPSLHITYPCSHGLYVVRLYGDALASYARIVDPLITLARDNPENLLSAYVSGLGSALSREAMLLVSNESSGGDK